MKEENKKFLNEIFGINVDDYDDETLNKILELIEAESIKNLYKLEANNQQLKEKLNEMLEMTYE